MGKTLLLIMLFFILSVLIAGHYGIIPSPWLTEGAKTMENRDQFVNRSVKVLESNPE